MIILGTNSIKAAGGYDVANSCRFNSGSSDSLTRTFSTPTSAKKFTISQWVKRSKTGESQILLNQSADYYYITSADVIDFETTTGRLKTNRLFRDLSAWYHIVIVVDTTLGTADDRIKMFINGVQETSFASRTNPSQDANFANFNSATQHSIAKRQSASDMFLNGYLAEQVFLDGTAAAITDLGEFDSDSPTIWKPIDVSGLTFGNNGFHLDFEDSSALGNDVSGNNNDFTANNLAAVDQSIDTCTNNFATMNSLANKVTSVNFSEGNLETGFGNGRGGSTSTFGLTTGKWYVEMNITTMPDDSRFHLGVVPFEIKAADDLHNTSNQGTDLSGYNAVIYANDDSGLSIINNFYGNATGRFSGTPIIAMALDLTSATKTMAFSVNGAWVTGSNTTDTDFSNALKVDISAYIARHDVWHIACGTGNSSGTSGVFEMNFGSPSFAISSGNADGNGYGNFEYAVPSGYFSLCTKNLAEYGG